MVKVEGKGCKENKWDEKVGAVPLDECIYIIRPNHSNE